MSTEPDEERPLPTNPEDAKRAKEMASVEANSALNDETLVSSKGIDHEALGKATADLGGGSTAKKKNSVGGAGAAASKVKVDGGDVGVVVCIPILSNWLFVGGYRGWRMDGMLM